MSSHHSPVAINPGAGNCMQESRHFVKGLGRKKKRKNVKGLNEEKRQKLTMVAAINLFNYHATIGTFSGLFLVRRPVANRTKREETKGIGKVMKGEKSTSCTDGWMVGSFDSPCDQQLRLTLRSRGSGGASLPPSPRHTSYSTPYHN